MCIIVYKPVGVDLPEESILRECWRVNAHGAGYMRTSKGTLYMKKGFMEIEEYLAAVRKIVRKDEPLVLHFRIASHGKVEPANTHPWVISKNLAMCHNGIINWLGDNRDVSDSARFAKLMRTFGDKAPYHPDMQLLIQQAIGTYNKIVFLNAEGKVWIANEHVGVWEGGCWFSNSGFRIAKVVPYQVQLAPADWGFGGGVWRRDSTVPTPTAPEVEEFGPEDVVLDMIPNFDAGTVTVSCSDGYQFEETFEDMLEGFDQFVFGGKYAGVAFHTLTRWLTTYKERLLNT